jgi:hypothetical protein
MERDEEKADRAVEAVKNVFCGLIIAFLKLATT